jgi:mRNA interferase MazF
MTNYKKGDLLLVDFPFADTGQAKRRPAMVVADTGDEDLPVARVTTQAARDNFDIEITEWKLAGLLAPSVVRLHKLATINKSRLGRKLGSLAASDRANVSIAVQLLCDGW